MKFVLFVRSLVVQSFGVSSLVGLRTAEFVVLGLWLFCVVLLVCLLACLLVCLFVCSLLVGCCWLDGGGRVVVVLGVRLLCSLDFGEPMECVMCCSGLFLVAIACCALCVGCDRPIWLVH